nr:MAG: hemolysin [Bacteriophage sp.]
MKEKELSVAEKTRKTKLSKKSIDELVNIILRKDDIERKNNKLIKCLKINIDGLEKKTKGLEEDYQKLEDINVSVNDSFDNLNRAYKETVKKLDDSLTTIKHYDDEIFSLQDKINRLVKSNSKYFSYGLIIGAIIVLVVKLIF